MKKVSSFLCLLLLWLPTAWAQSYLTGYVQNGGNPGGVNTESDAPGLGTWTTIVAGPQAANIWSAAIPLPFAFDFFGQPVTHFRASQTGVVTFDTATTILPGANENLPSPNLPNLSIAGFWDSFTSAAPTGTGDDIRINTFGTAPNRQFWIKWYSFEIGSPNLSFVYNCIVLEEGTNTVYVVDQYSSTTPALTATVGLQLDATTAVQFGTDQTPLSGNGTSTTDNDYYAFTPTSGAALDVTPINVSSSALVDAGCGGAAEPITIQVRSLGSSPTSGVLASFSVDGGPFVTPEAVPGTANLGDTLTYTFAATADLSAPGAHTVLVVASVLGDADNSNDTLSASFFTDPALAPPLPVVNFTGFNGSNLATVFPGWSEAAGQSVPSGTTSGWVSDDFGNVPGGPNGISAKINLWNLGDHAWIIGPKVAAGPTTVVEYDIAITGFGNTNAVTLGSDDSVVVLVSTDCGFTFTQLQVYDATTPVSNTGQTDQVSLGAFAGQTVIVAFFATEGLVDDPEDNDIFIDNINIKDLVPIDLGVTGVLAPAGAACYSAAETITVEIQNFGTATADFATLNTTVTVDVAGPNVGSYSTTLSSGTLAPGATMMVDVTTTADLSQVGTNVFTAYTTIAGDGNALNDTTTFTVETAPTFSVPYVEDFETFTVGNPGVTANGWTVSNSTSSFGWHVEQDGTQNSSGTGPIDDHTTGGAVYMFTETSSGTQGTEYFLTSACLDLSGTTTPQLAFWYHMFGDGMGTLEANVIRPGVDTTMVFSVSGQQQTAENDPWLQAIADLTAFAGETVQLMFKGIRGIDFESDMAIDDVEVFQPLPADMGAIALLSPSVSPGCTGANETVEVQIRNFGTSAIDFTVDPVQVGVDIAGPLAQNFSTTVNTGTLPPGDTLDVIVTTAADLSASGTYSFTIFTILAGDGNSTNDTTTATVTPGAAVAVPYLETFDAGFPTTWQNDPLDSGEDWRHSSAGNTTYGPDAVDHTTGSGRYMWVDDSSPNSNPINLITPCFSLTGLSNPVMEFWLWSQIEDANQDMILHLDLEVDGVWTNDIITPLASQGAAWVLISQSLTPYIGSTIRVRFRAEEVGTGFQHDIAIDDFRIFDQQTDDLGVIAIDAPGAGGREATSLALTATQPVTIRVVNFGLAAASNFDLVYQVNAGTPVVETVAGPLPAGDTLTYTFAATADFSAAGLYDLVTYAAYALDGDLSNDTLTTGVKNLANPAITLPFFEGFEATPDTAYFGGVFGVDGADRVDFESADPSGRLRTAAGVGFYNTGNRAATLDRDPSGTNVVNYMILTLNMTNYTTTDSILLSFALQNHGEENQPNDRVWVRGSDVDPWIEIANLNNLDGTPGSYVDIENINLSFSLDTAGQNFSSSTQLRFGQEDNFPATSTTVSDGYTFDDIEVTILSPNDAEALAILGLTSGICGDSMTMGMLVLGNNGFNPQTGLTATVIATSAAGADTFNISSGSTLNFNQADTVMFGPINTYAGGVFDIVAYTTLAGDDDNANDSTSVTVEFIPSEVLADPAAFCFGDSATLSVSNASGLASYIWYADSMGMNEIATGASYATGPLAASDTFYVGYADATDSLTTFFNSNNGCAGNMFDVIPALSTTVTGFAVNLDAIDPTERVYVFYKTGSYVGSETTPAAWTLLDSADVVPQGTDIPTFVPIGGLPLTAGQTYGMYVLVGSTNLNYTNGSSTTSNGALTIVSGNGSCTPFASPIADRQWNGTIFYTVDPCVTELTPVPVTVNQLPEVTFGADTASCDDPVVLDAGIVGGTYMWSTGGMAQTDTITMSGMVSVQVTDANGCVAGSDTIMVSIFDSPIVDLGADTSICEDAMLPLDAGNPGATYLWSTGSTDQTIMVDVAGTYDVTVTSAEGCATTDSISVGVDLLPIAAFTSAPAGLTVAFTSTASNADSVLWDFGGGNTSNEANPSFTFDASGAYTVTMVAFNACGTDTFAAEISVIGVSIDELLAAGSLSLYPNPTSGSFVLQLDLLRSAELRVEVVNLQGQRVHLSTFGQTAGSFSHAFDMPGLAEGIYLVKILLDDQMVTRKLQVE